MKGKTFYVSLFGKGLGVFFPYRGMPQIVRVKFHTEQSWRPKVGDFLYDE